MTVRTYQPQLTAFVAKNVHRRDGVAQRAADGPVLIDLTPFIGENSSVQISKSLYAPMGNWAIELVDQRPDYATDSIYGIVEPFDFIEIRMARSPHEYQGQMTVEGKLPIAMRGFVREVRRVEVMSADGKPQRKVILTGTDMGTIFNTCQIFYLAGYTTGDILNSIFEVWTLFGNEYRPMPASEFMQTMIDKIINPYLDNIFIIGGGGFENTDGNPFIPVIKSDLTVTEGTVNPYGVQQYEGPIWNLMLREADTGWNELFIEDREDAPYLIYRPMPFKDIDGNFIPQGNQAISAEEVAVDIEDVIQMDVARTDHNVANFYWVSMSSISYVNNTQLILAALNSEEVGGVPVFLRDYQNSDPKLYGDRKLEIDARQGYTELSTSPANLKEPRQRQTNDNFFDWNNHRRHTIIEFNKDNAVFEFGHIILKGNERIKPGKYIKLRRGSMTYEYYVTAVHHHFAPFAHYLTTVEVHRGTGFLERNRSETSPYFREGRMGPYDR